MECQLRGGTNTPSDRPIIRLPLAPLDLALLVLGGVAVILFIVVTAAYWSRLPEKIPTHFNFAGEPDAWGSKATLLLLPGVGTALYIGMAVLSRFPHVYNYLWRITEENAARQYLYARRLVLALGAEIGWLFLYITWQTVRTAQGHASGLGPFFLIAIVAGIFATVIVYFVNAARAR